MAEFGESRLENVVEYKIFDIHLSDVESEKSINIEDTLFNVLSFCQSLVGDYIWQNDSFNLHVKCETLSDKPKEADQSKEFQYLEGSTNFGDNIEDEWFIVYLLFSVTKQFPQLVVTMSDNDGEFLLIEAAEYLPKWLEPDTSENRVFIYQGNLNIIPLPRNPYEITVFPVGKLTVYQALQILKTNAEKTVALPWIQDPIMKKIEEYPKKSRESFHHVLCYVPPQVKYLLEKKNSLISSAVLAFVNRDTVDMTLCQKLTHFNSEFLVPYRVRFTKCIYSQLVKQNFVPDKNVIKFFPDISCSSYKGHLVGLQLTYGFEILCNQQSNCNAEGIAVSNGTACGQHWQKYLNSLAKNGYFQDEIVGSCLYTQLLEKAKEYFNTTCSNSEQSKNSISQLLADMPEPHKTPNELKPEQFLPDDNENWLEVSPDELESILSQYGHTGLPNSEDIDLKEVVNGMNSFVETISSYEGAEFSSEVSKEQDIQFDPEGFMKSLDRFFTPLNRNENDMISDDDSCSSKISDDEEMHEYTSAMDKELSSTIIGKSFVKVLDQSESINQNESPVQKIEDDEMKPVDIDLNLVQNFLESYSLQEGLPGPVSNILGSMGITLPENLPQHNDQANKV